MSRRQFATVLWSALLCWAGAILWLSSLRPDELPAAAFAFWDKANHFAAFALGGWLAAGALGLSMRRVTNARVVVLAVLLIAAFGAIDEALQTLTPGRVGADPLDWTADVLGGTTGAILNRLTRHARSGRTRSAQWPAGH